MKHEILLEFVENTQSHGEYTFSFNQALKHLGISKIALISALQRLQKKKVIVRMHEQFYLIVPIEYRNAGTLPPTWFIDSLMTHLNCDYYVGLLSAAALHGAGHQQPQQFQVIANKIFRPIQKNRIDIHFYKKSQINIKQKIKLKTPTGYLWVSKPEVTAIDLVAYMKSVGYLSNVVTVLSELLEKLDPRELLESAMDKIPIAILQRLGYLLDFCGGEQVSHLLHEWLQGQKIQIIPLRPDKDKENTEVNQKWKVQVNDIIEVDE